MKQYETGLIFDPTLEEAGFDEQIKKVTDIIESNSGEIDQVDRWGIRKLAYLIKKKPQGYYTFIYYNAPPEVPQLLEKMLRINESCLRFMTIVPEFIPEKVEEKIEVPPRTPSPREDAPVESPAETVSHTEPETTPETEVSEEAENTKFEENGEKPREDI